MIRERACPLKQFSKHTMLLRVAIGINHNYYNNLLYIYWKITLSALARYMQTNMINDTRHVQWYTKKKEKGRKKYKDIMRLYNCGKKQSQRSFHEASRLLLLFLLLHCIEMYQYTDNNGVRTICENQRKRRKYCMRLPMSHAWIHAFYYIIWG